MFYTDRRNEMGNTASHLAIDNGDISIVKGRINEKDNINTRNLNGETPLHWAVANASIEAIEFLLDAGADINAREKFFRTPLHYATNLELARGLAKRYDLTDESAKAIIMLLDKGAEPNYQDSDGKTALDYIDQNHSLYKSDAWWRLHDAKFNGADLDN